MFALKFLQMSFNPVPLPVQRGIGAVEDSHGRATTSGIATEGVAQKSRKVAKIGHFKTTISVHAYESIVVRIQQKCRGLIYYVKTEEPYFTR